MSIYLFFLKNIRDVKLVLLDLLPSRTFRSLSPIRTPPPLPLPRPDLVALAIPPLPRTPSAPPSTSRVAAAPRPRRRRPRGFPPPLLPSRPVEHCRRGVGRRGDPAGLPLGVSVERAIRSRVDCWRRR